MNNIFFASDFHFFHKNIMAYSNRPFDDVEKMNKYIIKQWNSIVGKEDVAWILGDIGFGNKQKITELVKQLNGKKRLILGNHDNFSLQTYFNMGFEIVSPFPIIWHGIYILSHAPMKDVPKGYINIYGHVHDDPRFPTYCKDGICVCIDRFKLSPINFKNLIENYKLYGKEYLSLSEYSNDEHHENDD